MTRYTALIDGQAGAYGVVIPDLPGCTAMGKTIDEAVRSAMSAAQEWAASMEAAGQPIPKARRMEEVVQDRDVREDLKGGAILATIPLLRDSGRPAKANISLDSGLLTALDEAADAHGLTRSAFIATAIREKIGAGV